jgi:dihydropteroate synthase
MTINNFFEKKNTINCKGNLVLFDTPKIMGILNFSPDSFYSQSIIKNDKEIKQRIEKFINEGTDFIDVGGASSRPGSKKIPIEDEWKRIEPALKILYNDYPNILFSVDTYNHAIAERSVLEYGAAIINDISAGNMDDKMFETIAKLKVPYIIMHMRGTPENMMQLTNYESLVNDIIKYFADKIEKLKLLGVNDIIIDPGFGFSKTPEQNYELLSSLELFNIFQLPVLVGLSRKSMIYKKLNISPEEALNGTSVVNTIALMKGADILRVHDVKEAKQVIAILKNLKQ